MPESALQRAAMAGRRNDRHTGGSDAIRAVWWGEVDAVLTEATPSGLLPGVYVKVPRLSDEQVHGPLPVAGGTPETGGRVLVLAVEGRKDHLIVLNPASSIPADLAERLQAVEDRAALNEITLGEHGARISDAEEQAYRNEQGLWEVERILWGGLEDNDGQWQPMDTTAGPWEPAPGLAPPQWRVFGGHVELRGHVVSEERGALFWLPSSVSPSAIEDTYITVVNGGEVMSIRLTLTTTGGVHLAFGALRGMDRLSANFSFNTPVPLSGVRLPL